MMGRSLFVRGRGAPLPLRCGAALAVVLMTPGALLLLGVLALDGAFRARKEPRA